MKKMALLMLATMALAGCAQTAEQKTLSAQDLENHHFVLQSVNGTPFVAPESGRVPEIGFGENLQLSGSMCNRFFGQATLQGDRLKAENLAMTRMMCAEPELNALDNQLGEMLHQGAQITLSGQQLTLKSEQNTLVYRLTNGQ